MMEPRYEDRTTERYRHWAEDCQERYKKEDDMDNGPGNTRREGATHRRQKQMGDPHYDNKSDVDPVEERKIMMKKKDECPIAPGDDKSCLGEGKCTFESICPHSKRRKNLELVVYVCPRCKGPMISGNSGVVHGDEISGRRKVPVTIRLVFQCDGCGREFAVLYNIDAVEEI